MISGSYYSGVDNYKGVPYYRKSAVVGGLWLGLGGSGLGLGEGGEGRGGGKEGEGRGVRVR